MSAVMCGCFQRGSQRQMLCREVHVSLAAKMTYPRQDQAETALVIETVVGVLVGSALTYFVTRLTRREDRTLTARILLSQTYPYLFANHIWQEVQIHLATLRVHLETSGIPDEVIERLEEAVRAGWNESQKQAEQDYDPEMGHLLPETETNAYREVEMVVHELLRSKAPFRLNKSSS